MTDPCLPVTHSQLVPAALAATVADAYGLSEASQVSLLRSWSNDVYALSADGGRFVLKVYRKAWRGPDDVRWEVELQDWLSKRHAPVPSVVPLVNGCLFGSLLAPEGARCFALFHRAPGDKPSPPWSPALYVEYGRACALLHEAATGFTSTPPRFQRDLPALLEEPALEIEAWLGSRLEDAQTIRRVEHVASQHLRRLLPGLHWGVCHGDVSLDNLQMLPDGRLMLYDFDLSCYGWQSWDVCNAMGYASPECQDAFLRGYRSVRSFSADEVAAVPYFMAADALRLMAGKITRRTRWFGTDRVEAWVADKLTWLRQWEREHAA